MEILNEQVMFWRLANDVHYIIELPVFFCVCFFQILMSVAELERTPNQTSVFPIAVCVFIALQVLFSQIA